MSSKQPLIDNENPLDQSSIVEKNTTKRRWTDLFRSSGPVILALLVFAILLLLPTGYEDAVIYQDAERCTAEILSVDNSSIVDNGLVRTGEQRCVIRLQNGLFQGEETEGVNLLQGSLEQDKLFEPGDRALVVVSHADGEISNVTISDHYRLAWELVLAGGFALLLILFAGKTGIRAILSFILTVLTMWKILIPLLLQGINPIWVGLGIVLVLTILIITLVFGFDRRSLTAISGVFLGIFVTCILGILFTDLFQIHGAVMQYSESLLYSGYQHLNLTQIFMASIFIGASGAIMDLAVDITSAVNEVVEKRPDIGWREAARSGMNVGRAAMGTMTTTLLFAYSGGYLALLMVFMAQGTPVTHILNYRYVASEIAHTIIGSIGLVLVVPITALCAGIFLSKKGFHPVKRTHESLS